MASPLDGRLAAAASRLLISARGAPSRVILRQQGSDRTSASNRSTMASLYRMLQSPSNVLMSWMASACSRNAGVTEGPTYIAVCANLIKGSKTLQRRRVGAPIPLSRSSSGARLLATSPGVSTDMEHCPLCPCCVAARPPLLHFQTPCHPCSQLLARLLPHQLCSQSVRPRGRNVGGPVIDACLLL